MKEIIFATTNPAKIKQLGGVLAAIGINVRGISGKSGLPRVQEDGASLQENARKKAAAYAKALGKTVLSMDNGLYFDGLPDAEQPGTHVRRINGGAEASDEEMLRHYARFVEGLGGKVNGRWEYALCVATPDGGYRETTITSPRLFTANISPKMIAGYPLESTQIDPKSGKYISEMSQEEQDLFWQREIGDEIRNFFESPGVLR